MLSDSEDVRLPRPAREIWGRLITKRDDRFMLRNLLTSRCAPKKNRDEEVEEGEDVCEGADTSLGKQEQIGDDYADDSDDDENNKSGISDADDNDKEDAKEDEEDQDTGVLSNPDDDNDPKQKDSPWSSILTREKVEDFGMVWKAHGAVYPLDINPRIKWPCPAEELRGQPITKAHDKFMFEELLACAGSESESGQEDDRMDDVDRGYKRKLEESYSTSANSEGPKKRKPNDDDEDDDEDEDEDEDEEMMTLG